MRTIIAVFVALAATLPAAQPANANGKASPGSVHPSHPPERPDLRRNDEHAWNHHEPDRHRLEHRFWDHDRDRMAHLTPRPESDSKNMSAPRWTGRENFARHEEPGRSDASTFRRDPKERDPKEVAIVNDPKEVPINTNPREIPIR